MKYIVFPVAANHPATHRDASGTLVSVEGFADSVQIGTPHPVVKSLDGYTQVSGFVVSPEGFELDKSAESQAAFTSLVTLLKAKETASDSQVPIKDAAGNIHMIEFGRLMEVLIQYGEQCYQNRMTGN